VQRRGPRPAWFAAAVAAAGLALGGTVLAAEPDPARGRALVESRSQGLCVLCHRVPGVPDHLQGTLAPDLAGAGRRFDADLLRQRLREPQRFNPESIMPAYGAADGARPELQRVAPAWRGRPLLTDAQLDDVVAYLMTLR